MKELSRALKFLTAMVIWGFATMIMLAVITVAVTETAKRGTFVTDDVTMMVIVGAFALIMYWLGFKVIQLDD